MIYQLTSERPGEILEQLRSQGITGEEAQRQLTRQIDFRNGMTTQVEIVYAVLGFLPIVFFSVAWLLERRVATGRLFQFAMAVFILFSLICLGDTLLASRKGVSVKLHWLGE